MDTVDRSTRPDRTPAVALVRASRDTQTRSVPQQVEQVREAAERLGLDLGRVFEDLGISGYRTDRPGLVALLEYVERVRSGGVVLIWQRSRLLRRVDPREGLALEYRIEQAGWQIHYLHGAQPTGYPVVDTITAAVEHGDAGVKLPKLAIDSLRGLRDRVRRGGVWVGRVPYAYARQVTWATGDVQVLPRTIGRATSPQAESVRLVLGDPDEVRLVQWVFEVYAEGDLGLGALAAELNAREIPTPSPRSTAWRAGVLGQVLRNPVYRGDLTWNRRSFGRFGELSDSELRLKEEAGPRYRQHDEADWITVPDSHPAIVARELWARANHVLDQRGRERGGRRRAVSPYPLTGLVRCGVCGSTMTGASYSAAGRRYRRYQCSGYGHSRTCHPYALSQPVLEEALLVKLAERLAPLADDPRLRERIVAELRQLGAGVAPDVEGLERQQARLRRQRNCSYENLSVVGQRLARELAVTIEGLDARIEALQAEIEETRAASPQFSLDDLADRAVGLLADLAEIGMASPPADRRRVFRAAIERVELRFRTEEPPPGRQRRRHHFEGGRIELTPAASRLCVVAYSGSPPLPGGPERSRAGLGRGERPPG